MTGQTLRRVLPPVFGVIALFMVGCTVQLVVPFSVNGETFELKIEVTEAGVVQLGFTVDSTIVAGRLERAPAVMGEEMAYLLVLDSWRDGEGPREAIDARVSALLQLGQTSWRLASIDDAHRAVLDILRAMGAELSAETQDALRQSIERLWIEPWLSAIATGHGGN